MKLTEKVPKVDHRRPKHLQEYLQEDQVSMAVCVAQGRASVAVVCGTLHAHIGSGTNSKCVHSHVLLKSC